MGVDGERRDDSLDTADQFAVADAAARFPAHDLAMRRNTDGMIWAVLAPRGATPALLRFTFCRIGPSIIVEIVDQEGGRQFCTAPAIEQALDVARAMSDQAMLATLTPGRELVH